MAPNCCRRSAMVCSSYGWAVVTGSVASSFVEGAGQI